MNEKILFIGNANTFTVNTFIENMAEEGFDCDVVIPIAAISTKLDPAYRVVILFLDEGMFSETKLVPVIKSYVEQDHKVLILVGYESELVYIMPQFPSDMITDFFSRPVSAKDVAGAIPESTTKRGGNSKKQILVVDDSGPMLRSVKGWLEPKYKVTMANSPASALFYLADNTPDLILLDYEMPGCDGATLLGILRNDEKTANIPVIFLTGKDDMDTVLDVAKQNPDGYILKSQSDSKIIDRINKFFEGQ